MDITKRIDLNLGYSCNLNCRFCYYQRSMASTERGVRRDLTTGEAKRWLRFFRKKGLEEVDLTGGEPTIRDDIFELIEYARGIGYRTVCLITNGIRLADGDFTRRLGESGLNDILFSLHGPDSSVHDNLTRTPGSFDKIIRAMENTAELPIRRRSNTVVNGINYTRLDEMAGLLLELGMERINFILFNPVVEAQAADDTINLRYRDAAPYIQRVIRQYDRSFEKITVRYIPFCLMEGYEKYIVNCPQVQYDPDEWDYLWRSYFRRSLPIWLAALAGGFLLHPGRRHLLSLDFQAACRESIMWSIIAVNKIKGRQCRRCRYYRICDGLWREYAARFGFEELIPVAGRKISDPTIIFSAKK